MTTDAIEKIKSLHAQYVSLTGRPLRLLPQFEHAWFDWMEAGFTENDLRAVISLRTRGIKREHRRHECLCFRNLISDLGSFADDLAQCQQRKPARYPPDKASVLRQTGREDAPTTGSEVKVGDVFRKIVASLETPTVTESKQ